ncbi:glycosyltransferase [Exiguobacterium sp. S22-S28]|uniref:glycosyltransferase n=1 Tax=Exiguobacterium sp. S22-S28 TaxID=3342768 RepID=UPI00372D2311
MNQGHIAIFTDHGRQISYETLIPYYPVLFYTQSGQYPASFEQIAITEVQSAEEEHEIKLYIVDYQMHEDELKIVNQIRQVRSRAKILLIQDVVPKKGDFPYEAVKGDGVLRSFPYRSSYPNELFAEIQRIIHPEYPILKDTIAFILPIFNEEKRFMHVKQFLEALAELISEDYIHASINFFDDASSDRSKALLQDYRSIVMDATDTLFTVGYLEVHQVEQNTRKAGLFIEGMKNISSDYYVFVDADNSFKTEDIARLLTIAQHDYYDIVVGTKDLTIEDRGLVRRLLSFAKRNLTRTFLPKGVTDSQTGLKIINRRVVPRILPYLNVESGLAIDLELMYAAKKERLRVFQQPVTCIEREGSHVNLVKDSIAFLKTMLALYRRHR